MNSHSCHSKQALSQSQERALKLLKESGHKITKPRKVLLSAIAGFSTPFSAEDAYRAAKKQTRGSQIDLVTIYRGLSTFSDLGILGHIDFGDGKVRYEFVDPSGHHHHHFVCQTCHKVEPLTHCELKEQEEHLRKDGYTGLSHRLEFFGLCPQCSSRK